MKGISLFCKLALIAGLSSCFTATGIFTDTGEKIQAESFISFLGLQRGDVFMKAENIFGKPHKLDMNEGQYDFATAYYEVNGKTALSISYNKGTQVISSIRLRLSDEVGLSPESTFKFLLQNKVDDIRASMLGENKSKILDAYGYPSSFLSGNYEYKRQDLLVDFICYEFNQNLCSEIYVQWFY